MNLRDHQICELLEDGADISKRLFGAQKTVERITHTNAAILRELVAENRRLRISQLRRMADRADTLATTAEMPYYARFEKKRIAERLRRFIAACLAEIERLRGMG